MKLRISNTRYGALLSLPGLILLLTLVMFPTGYLFYLSFMRYDNINPVTFQGLSNYEYIFNDRVFWLATKNTLIFCAGSTALTFFVGLILGHGLNRITRGAAIFRSLMILPWAVPLVISGFIWAWVFNPSFGVFSDALLKIGLISEPLNIFGDPGLAMAGVIVADAWTRIPFMTVLVLAGLQGISDELYDAAKVDGADILHRFRYISLPLNRRPMFLGLFITAMFSFRTVDVIFSMTPGGGVSKSTYLAGVYLFDHIYKYLDFGVAAAVGVVIFLMISVLGAGFLYFTLKE